MYRNDPLALGLVGADVEIKGGVVVACIDSIDMVFVAFFLSSKSLLYVTLVGV